MPTDQSLQELIAAGVELTYAEAIAIAQELITSVPIDDCAVPPFSAPSLDNVRIYPDGSVECLACGSTPAVSEVARLLEAMLWREDGKSRLPGSLRYTIARAQLEVDAPPFDTVAEFSAALARHERGDRSDIVRALFARAAPAHARVVDVQSERRRRAPSASELRRQLRLADEALFYEAQANRRVAAEHTVPPAMEPVALPPRTNIVHTVKRSAAFRWLVTGAAAALIGFGAGYAVVHQFDAVTAPAMSTTVATARVPAATARGRTTPFAMVPSTLAPAPQVPTVTRSRAAR
ncbi:MAG: hypothetical protein JWL71_1154, partial [Acidobacteria bacterium]|nr:hypothetical protein [Acidobacteriota bacterium]